MARTVTRRERMERFVASVSEPDALEVMCDKISDGITLSDLARELGANFMWLYSWLYDEAAPDRSKALQRAMDARDAMAREDVIGQIHRLANVDIRRMFDKRGNLLPIHQLPEDVAKAVSSIETVENEQGDVTKKVKLVDRGQMLALGGRRQKMFTDKVDLGVGKTLEQAVLESLGNG